MSNQNDIMLAYNFCVSLGGVDFRACKVRSVEQSVELETVCEGGRNFAAHVFVKPSAEAKKLIVERGACSRENAAAIRLLLGVHQVLPMLIMIFDRSNTQMQRTYIVENWMLVKWTLSDLDASAQSGVLLETAEFVYDRLWELM